MIKVHVKLTIPDYKFWDRIADGSGEIYAVLKGLAADGCGHIEIEDVEYIREDEP